MTIVAPYSISCTGTESTDTKRRRQLENVSESGSDDLDSKKENHSSMVVELPGDITELIVNKLDPVSFHCFGAVCKRLHSITIAAKKRLQPLLPWLMYNSCSATDHELPKFFSLSHGKISRLKLVEACGIRCCSSSWGWLIMANKRSNNKNNIFLLNPFTRIQIQLPKRAIFYDNGGGKSHWFNVTPPPHYIRKALLLSPPTTTTNLNDIDMDCVVVVIDCQFYLHFCRLGDEEWTRIEGRKFENFEDIILYHGQLYAITRSFQLVRMDLGVPYPKVISCGIAPPPPECQAGKDGGCKRWCVCRSGHLADHDTAVYLVESIVGGGELLMVIRCWHTECEYPDDTERKRWAERYYHSRTHMLTVFKLDPKGQCWTKMENLLHQMIFLGSGNAVALSALDYPDFTSGNCIYFIQQTFELCTRTEIVPRAYRDTGVFHLADKSIKPFVLDDDDGDVTPHSPPIWFTPFSTSR